MSTKKALNISDVLSKLDRNDFDFYDSLNEAELKELSPWVLMRFMSSCDSNPEIYLLSVNENVNIDFSIVSKHKKLMCLLLAACGIGTKQSHKWIAPPKKTKKPLSGLADILKEVMYDKNDHEIDIIINTNNKDDIIDYLTMSGVDEKRIQAIFDE